MIDWSKGISARYYASIINPYTWEDVRDLDIISGSIKYSDIGERISADIECRNFDHDNEYWIRLYLVGRQGSDIERVPLFTGIVSNPDISYNGRRETNNLQCYSPLSLADKIYLPLGWYVPIGSNGAKMVQELLSGVVMAPVVVEDVPEEDIPIISQNIIADNGETNLSMVDRILDIINWKIVVEGDGIIYISPYSFDVVASFNSQTNDIFEMDVTVSNNWYDVPNVYRAVGEGVSSTARDEDPNSIFSIQNRGREIWVNDTDCVLTENEKIGEYALRKLKEAQQVYKSIDYTRRFDPDVHISDIVSINYMEQGISGLFIVKSQSIELGYGGRVSEQVEEL